MALTAPKSKSFDPVPKGNHVARLYQIIHIGTVPTTWQGETRMSNKVRLTFELCNEQKVFKEGDDPKPYSISREFTFSMGKKAALRAFIEGFGGTALHDDEAYSFDIEKLLGEACLLNVVHAEREGVTYANIAGASPLPKGLEAPPLFNEAKLIDVNSASFEEIEALPEFLRDKIKSSEEYGFKVKHQSNLETAGMSGKRPTAHGDDDIDPNDVPF
jgi:hypothetical protein